MPLGNLTSQIFANIYLNQLDQFAKHRLGEKFYIRYTDDFVIIGNNQAELTKLITEIDCFLKSKLRLGLHPKKVTVRKLRQGIDFLGYVILPHYCLLRTKSKKRMLKRINQQNFASYSGLLAHCNGYELGEKILLSLEMDKGE